VRKPKTQGILHSRQVTFAKSDDQPSKASRTAKPTRMCLSHIMKEYDVPGAKSCPHGDACTFWHADSTTDGARIRKELNVYRGTSLFRMIVGSKEADLLQRAGLA
jgi:hypothetical protein